MQRKVNGVNYVFFDKEYRISRGITTEITKYGKASAHPYNL